MCVCQYCGGIDYEIKIFDGMVLRAVKSRIQGPVHSTLTYCHAKVKFLVQSFCKQFNLGDKIPPHLFDLNREQVITGTTRCNR